LNVINKLFAYVKDEGKNLHTLVMTLFKVISCVTWCRACFGHINVKSLLVWGINMVKFFKFCIQLTTNLMEALMVLYLYLQKFLVHFLVSMSKIVNWILGRRFFCLFYHFLPYATTNKNIYFSMKETFWNRHIHCCSKLWIKPKSPIKLGRNGTLHVLKMLCESGT